MMQPIYLICGVPGSGKSWVCEQLKSDFEYLCHDDYSKENFPVLLAQATISSNKPVLADCPFAERELRERLFEKGCHVISVFIIETPEICQARYEEREEAKRRKLHPYPKQFLSRAASIASRAVEWKAFRGTSQEVLDHLKGLAHE